MKLASLALALTFAVVGTANAQIDDLIKDLKTGNADNRRAAARKLGEMKDEGKPAAAALVQALKKDDDTYVRRFAAQALGEIGPAKGSVSALAEALNDKQSSVVNAAAAALGKMGKAAAKPLSEVVANKRLTESTRRQAIVSLGKIGADAKAAVPALIEALKDKELRLNATEALGDVGPNAKDALETFKTMMEDRRIRRDRSFAQAARTAMRKIERGK